MAYLGFQGTGPNRHNMVSLSNVHGDVIHDAELDYYGQRLATCSSDQTIKIFEVSEQDGSQRLLDTLRGHEGPVWQIVWGHPKFGGGSGAGLLASCGYDGKVLVWKEDRANGPWRLLASYTEHSASVNSIAWAPVEYGCVLLAGSSDGRVSVVEVKPEGSCVAQCVINAHQIGTNAVSWAPFQDTGADEVVTVHNEQGGNKKGFVNLKPIVTGGSDNLVKIWKLKSEDSQEYELDTVLEGHSDWVRDVTWSPSTLLRNYIASGSQDRRVLIWTQDPATEKWEKTELREQPFPDIVWRLSWSLSGNILAVSGGDNKVTLWKEGQQGKWETAGEIAE